MSNARFRLGLIALCIAGVGLYVLQQSLLQTSHGISPWRVQQLLGLHAPPSEVGCRPRACNVCPADGGHRMPGMLKLLCS
jgi:hypothetical protein